MKNKILPIFLLVVLMFSAFSVTSFADEFLFTVDVNEQYTDISYVDETNVLGEVQKEETQDDLQSKKTIYIAVLSVLLVISVIILIVTLKKAEQGKIDIRLKDETENINE